MSCLPWLRLYANAIDDEKLRLLAFEDRWHFIAILCLKQQGILETKPGLKERKIAIKLGLQLAELDEVKRRLMEVELIAEDWNPVSWQKLQFKSDSSAERVRKFRESKKKKERNAGVTLQKQKCNVLDTDTDTDTDTEKNLSGKPDYHSQRETIISYLNNKAGFKFQPHTQLCKKHINARLNDGHIIEDFMLVIDSKFKEWWGNQKMQKCIRPLTLFGNKFDEYLGAAHIQQPEKPKTSIDIMLENLRETNDKTGSNGNNGQIISGNGITVGQDSISQAGDLCPAPQYMGKGNDPFGW